MTETEIIIDIIKNKLNATSENTFVDAEAIITKGVELGYTELNGDYREHPWNFTLSCLVGVFSPDDIETDKHLHRKNMKMTNGSFSMYYWYDTESEFTLARQSLTSVFAKKPLESEFDTRNLSPVEYFSAIPAELLGRLTPAEKFTLYDQYNPGCYLLVGDKIILVDWIKENKARFKKLYGTWIETHQEEFKSIEHIYN